MLREMRSISKYVFWVVAVTFIGWLAYGQVQEILTGSRDTVFKINREEIHLAQYQAALQAAYEQARQQNGLATLTREDEKQIQDEVTNQLIQSTLLHQEYRRLGITVTDEEVIEAARTSPPPEVMRVPDFQTNGQFDITKWQRFLAAGSNPELLAQLEARYRDQIPQIKLSEYLTADVYVSDAKLWRIYRDQHDSVSVALLAVRPQLLDDTLAPMPDADLQRYYAAHKDDFKQAAVAFVSFVAQPRAPDPTDTAVALARVRRVHAELAAAGLPKFEATAKRESADSTSGARGGDLGWIKRGQAGYDPRFLAGLRPLSPGQLSAPVLSNFGYHLIRVDAAKGDSVHVRHILIPIELQGAHRDLVEARADTLERLAAEHEDGTALDSAARRMSLPVGRAPKLVEGDRLTLGRYVIPNVSVWAFEAKVGETSPLFEGEPAYYVFRLDSLIPAGVPPLAVIRDRVVFAARLEKKKVIAQRRAQEIATALAGASGLAQAGAAHGWPVSTLAAFTRTAPPPALQREPLVLGTAFGLRVGERSGALASDGGYFFVESLSRKQADSSAWLAQRDQQRVTVMDPVRQARIRDYVAALRQQAKIVDRRKELFRPHNAVAGS
jgi:peptidyl-prolyl cis-trans isomerase D